MKYLVTGGAGYIGGIVTQLLLDAGHEVTVLDDLSRGHRDAVRPGASFVDGRVQELAAQVLDASFDGVLHFAGLILAGESVEQPERYWENNLVSSLRLLDAMRAAGVRRLVFSSTANIYGDPDELPIKETAQSRPPKRVVRQGPSATAITCTPRPAPTLLVSLTSRIAPGLAQP